eukprot:TRINITY_DN557_c0_g1_i2.p1 TRINITY_DN557_c0_g1~~TRINITY_DN557_c0_g1_i2.p1  ORF type:complete len:269 (+),score=79.84 TRINITY_DN557_c0_g1_i2:103-909(+)
MMFNTARLGLLAMMAVVAMAGDEGTIEIITAPKANDGGPSADLVAVARPGLSSANVALLADEVDAWPDLMGSRLHSPPAFLELLPVTMGEWQLPVGSSVKFTCPDTPAVTDVCVAWVFFYTCSHTCVTKYQGGLPGLLSVTPGWERNQCAPRFSTGVLRGYYHPMGAFRKQLARGETTTFSIPGAEHGEFLAFGIDGKGLDCARHTTAGTCPTATGKCMWDAVNSECRPTDCKGPSRGGQGPSQLCRECPWEGIVSPPRPFADGPFAL